MAGEPQPLGLIGVDHAARLKVHRTSAGFDDAYVAAQSQAAAPKAWGARGGLFEALTAEPLTRPGESIHRPQGARDEGRQPRLSCDRPWALQAAEKALDDARERLKIEPQIIAEERAHRTVRGSGAAGGWKAEVKRLDRAKVEAGRTYLMTSRAS